jgi:hypothetical protein
LFRHKELRISDSSGTSTDYISPRRLVKPRTKAREKKGMRAHRFENSHGR